VSERKNNVNNVKVIDVKESSDCFKERQNFRRFI